MSLARVENVRYVPPDCLRAFDDLCAHSGEVVRAFLLPLLPQRQLSVLAFLDDVHEDSLELVRQLGSLNLQDLGLALAS